MLLDKRNLFSDNQDLAKAAGNYLSDFSVDMLAAGTDFHGGKIPGEKGTEIEVFAQVTTAFATGTSVQAQLVSADDAGLTTNLTVLQQSDVIPTAKLVPGYRFRLGTDLPNGITQQYLGLRYVLAGASAFTAGKITAGLAGDLDTTGNLS